MPITLGSGAFGSSPLGGSGSGGSSGTTSGAAFDADVTLWVEIDLSQAVDDIGVASSYLPLWDVAVWDEDVWGDGTTWTDVSEWVRGIQTDRAFSRELVAYNAGACRVELDNSDGRFSPENTSSPYRLGDSTTIGVLRPIRIRAEYAGIGWVLFTGRIEEWPQSFQGPEGATVIVSAVDAFAELAAFDSYEQTPQGASETFGDRIHRIINNAGWKGEHRIDTGGHTMQATTLASNAATELKLTADSEGGAVWVGGEGIFYADGQDALIEKDRSVEVQVTFSNSDDDTAVGYDMDSMEPQYDGSQVVNIAAYARAGGSVRTATAAASRALYGDRQDTRSDLICETDAQVDYLCERTIALYQKPEQRIERLRFTPQRQPSEARVAVAWDALARGLLALRNLVQVEHTTAAGYTITKRLYVRGIHHTISATTNTWTVDLDFASATVQSQFHDSRWDLGVWDTAVWSW